jgi:hypothetical protein
MVTAIHCDVTEPFQIKAVCHFQDIYRKLVRGATDRGEYRQAAGAFAQAIIRSVELIVQPGAHDVVGEMGADQDRAQSRLAERVILGAKIPAPGREAALLPPLSRGIGAPQDRADLHRYPAHSALFIDPHQRI